MKRIIAIALLFVFCGSLCACSPKEQKSRAEIVSEQLSGTWISYDSKNVFSKWTFIDGNYTLEIFVDGNKQNKANYGSYKIGSDSIYTVQQGEQSVSGEIPYSVEDGVLHLHGANGDLSKLE